MIVQQPIVNAPLPRYSIMMDRIIPMRAFVEETIDQPRTLQQFMGRQFVRLQANYVYSFVIVKGEDQWRLFKRLVDFRDFSGILTTYYRKAPASFLLETNEANPSLFNEMHQYLEVCSRDPSVHIPFMTFIEDSNHNYGGMIKYGEMFMDKRSKGRQGERLRCQGCCRNWHTRYFIIHSEGVIYKDEQNRVREYIPYNLDFVTLSGPIETKHDLRIILESTHRRLTIQAHNEFDFIRFLYGVKMGFLNSDYAKMNRFDSFAPTRQNCQVQFYPDGADYFRNMCDALLAAQCQVLITDWWLSPEFYLIRPVTPQTECYRFDRVIGMLAARGVNIRIILYQEPTVLTNGSLYTKQTLERLNPQRIHVVRHPNTVVPFLWSHHQKMMVIDSAVAFMGGLDIAYSRYDTPDHAIFDYGGNMFPGIEYTNERIQAVKNVEHFSKIHLDRNRPRMPWHDVGLKVYGEVVWDLTTHFVQYWNYAICNVKLNNAGTIRQDANCCAKGCAGCRQGLFYIKDLFRRMIRYCCPVKDPRKYGRYVELLAGQNPLLQLEMMGKGETGRHLFTHEATKNITFQQKLLRKHRMIEEDLDKGMDPRFVKILIQLEKRSITEKERFDDDFIEFNRSTKQRRLMYYNPLRMEVRKNRQAALPPDRRGNMRCQIVRSSCSWSRGTSDSDTEFSIQIAYIQMIAKAKHYIYIENQFFMSSTAHKSIKNNICYALIERITLAFERGQPFKVYIFLPLLPSNPGEIDHPDSTVLRLTLDLEQKTISKSVTSMIGQLQAKVGAWQNYLQFFSLRNHGRRTPTSPPATELIYIHTKMMIVDDDRIIVGSANINDRSMNGDRDSELAMVATDMDKVQGVMNGQYIPISKSVYELRAKLWAEHFGITDPRELDPLSEYTWNLTRRISMQNTQIYRTLFGCYPDNNCRTFSDLHALKAKATPQRYAQLVPSLRGHVVQFPIYFLELESLGSKAGKKQALAPSITLT